MHLASAVESKISKKHNRACVVIAGGREPVHWEAYPTHQFIHTIGALSCCQNGGCWRSRTIPLGDESKLARLSGFEGSSLSKPLEINKSIQKVCTTKA